MTNLNMFPIKLSVRPATLKSCMRHIVPGPYLVTEYVFLVPLDYANPDGEKIQLFARAATKFEPSPFGCPPDLDDLGPPQMSNLRPWIVYLQGGPGFGCPEPQDYSLTRFVLNKGYQCLYLDYRGVGLSTPVTAGTLDNLPLARLEYLKLFRQDNNVRDLEAVRQYLTALNPDPNKRQWSILGQSFGGFVALTYLSTYPEGLREVFMLGGLAPISKSPQEVYQSTFAKVEQRNLAYYSKFPEDIERVHDITKWLESAFPVALPGGGILSPRRFLTLGHMFGMHGGLDSVHGMVLRMCMDIDQYGKLTRPTLTAFEAFLPFDSCPIYAILHEAIYCYRPGLASKWAAQAVGEKLESFKWLSPAFTFNTQPSWETKPLCFSGEMIFPFMLEDYPELLALRQDALLLAEYDKWDALYDEERLKRNMVPVFAASYIEDMYVDYDLAKETARKVKGIKTFETNTMYHNALRARTDEVLQQLFKLRDDCLE